MGKIYEQCVTICYATVMIKLSMVLLSAILFPLALPNQLLPNGSFLLGMVALVPYLRVIYQERSFVMRLRYGAYFGLISSFLNFYWLLFFEEFSLWTLPPIAIGYAGCHMILANIFYRVGQQTRWRPWLVALIWSSFEYIKSIGYLAFPWGLIAFPASISLPLIQHIDITGIWSLSLLMALTNCLITEWSLQLRPRPTLRRDSIWLLATFGLLLGYGYLRLANVPQPADHISLALIQQNTDSWTADGARTSLASNVALTKAVLEQHQPAMVIWSETSMRFSYHENRLFYERYPEDEPLLPFLQRGDWHLLSGAPYYQQGAQGQDQYYNAAIQLNPQGELLNVYRKRQLIPFAEHIPFWDIPFFQRLFSNVIGLYGSWHIGRETTIFQLPHKDTSLLFGVLICFEDSFGYLGRDARRAGAQMIVNLTNNSWSRTEAAQIQHFAVARLRAVENRIALVRSTNSGVTAVVDARGEILAELPMFEKGWLVVDVPLYGEQPLTIYSRFGDWFGKLLLLAALLIYALSWRQPVILGIPRSHN